MKQVIEFDISFVKVQEIQIEEGSCREMTEHREEIQMLKNLVVSRPVKHIPKQDNGKGQDEKRNG